MSSGTASSHVLMTWISRVARTATQPGPNGRVPAFQRIGTPET